MNFKCGLMDVDVTLITRKPNNTWVGIIIESDTKVIESVSCFTPDNTFNYFAYNTDMEGYRLILFHRAVKYIREHNILEEL